MSDGSVGMTRRELLTRIGLWGGTPAVYEAMVALGLLAEPSQAGQPGRPDPGSRTETEQGRSVVVVGSGVAGLTAAYELERLGYRCTVLEALERPGGRNWTIRRGDRVEERGQNRQLCRFDDDPGLYFNAGPGRISHHHANMLQYCREFDVALEPFLIRNHATLFYDDTRDPAVCATDKRLLHDVRGRIAELLAKAVRRGALDDEVDDDDRLRLLDLLESFGDLDAEDNHRYKGTTRGGYAVGPDLIGQGEPHPPTELSDILQGEFWQLAMSFSDRYLYQPTMFQPVGGMDQIVKAFVERLTGPIRFGCPVTSIRNRNGSVRVTYHDRKRDTLEVVDADACVVTLALPVLATLDTDFDPAFRGKISEVEFGTAAKLAWQADRRFWEEDDQIYGGITWTTREIRQIWYPSHGYLGRKGVLVGAYCFGDTAREFADLGVDGRIRAARLSGQAIHPCFADETTRPITVAWHLVPGFAGAWASFRREHGEDDGADPTVRAELAQPQGQVYLCGDYLSPLNAWQEGAVLSAYRVIDQIRDRINRGSR